MHLFRGREPFRQACSDNLVRKSRPLVLFFWECACLLAVYYVFFRRYAHVCVCVLICIDICACMYTGLGSTARSQIPSGAEPGSRQWD